MIMTQREIQTYRNKRLGNGLIKIPHVLILGASASKAAFPKGDLNEFELPLMNNLIEVVGLSDLLESTNIKYEGENKDGRFQARELSKEKRRECVEVLVLEGYSVSLVTQLLDRCEKTIKRDIEDIREHNSLMPSGELAKKIVGEIIAYANINRAHLMRMARSKEASVSEKSQAEFLAWRVQKELSERLQTLGFLPSKPTEVVHTLFYGSEDNISKPISTKELPEETREAMRQITEMGPEGRKELIKKLKEEGVIGTRTEKGE